MRSIRHRSLAAIGVVLLALVAAACGSSSSSSTSAATPSGVPTSGPGLTAPTAPSGTKISGGTVYFAEGSQVTPNYIFPMYSPQVCSVANASQFMPLMFRPLYWYGNDYRPTIDYDYSLGQQPVFSGGNKTVTIKLNAYKWSNGETVTSRDLVFWMNVLKASPATEWCGYVPGFFPDNVTSFSAPDPSTFVLHLSKAYDPEWFIYNELSQLTPLPLAWDRTSLSQPAPTSDNGHLPDTTKSGAGAIFKFLDGESKKPGSWASSPLWSVVDGPFKLQAYTSSGEATLVPNPAYSGSPKPTISKFVELPFTSEAAIFNEMRSAGPSAITVSTLPSQYAPQIPTLVNQGYVDNKGGSYSFNYFPVNFNSNAPTSPGGEPVGYILRQLYFRQAFQHLIDQSGWINAFLFHTADLTTNPVPPAPPSPLVNASALSNPYPFSVSAAKQLLTSHGWNVAAGGSTTCQNPSLCGAGIKKGEGISFNLDYLSGAVSTQDEMNDLVAQAKKVGISISLTSHPFNTVISTAVACTMTESKCKWSAQNWGAGWIYAPDYLPTGESLFQPGSVANYGTYSDPTGKAQKLINATIYGPLSQEKTAMTTFATYMAQDLPVMYGPTSLGVFYAGAGTLVSKHLGGFAANAFENMTPENWYFTK